MYFYIKQWIIIIIIILFLYVKKNRSHFDHFASRTKHIFRTERNRYNLRMPRRRPRNKRWQILECSMPAREDMYYKYGIDRVGVHRLFRDGNKFTTVTFVQQERVALTFWCAESSFQDRDWKLIHSRMVGHSGGLLFV